MGATKEQVQAAMAKAIETKHFDYGFSPTHIGTAKFADGYKLVVFYPPDQQLPMMMPSEYEGVPVVHRTIPKAY